MLRYCRDEGDEMRGKINFDTGKFPVGVIDTRLEEMLLTFVEGWREIIFFGKYDKKNKCVGALMSYFSGVCSRSFLGNLKNVLDFNYDFKGKKLLKLHKNINNQKHLLD